MRSFFLERLCDKLANYLFDGHTANVEFLNIDSAVDVDVGIKAKLAVADTFDLDIRTELDAGVRRTNTKSAGTRFTFASTAGTSSRFTLATAGTFASTARTFASTARTFPSGTSSRFTFATSGTH